MSDFKEIINYLKFFRRGDEASAKNKFYQALILDKSYALSKIPHEDDYIFVEKEAIASQNTYEYVGNQIDGDEKNLYLLDQPDGETAYYIKKIFDENGVAVTRYKQIPYHLSDSWEIVNEEAFTIIAVESKSSSLFYSYALNKIIELSLDPVFVYPDYFVYHPEDLSGITDGNYNFNYKDAEGYSSDVADLFLRSVTSPWYNAVNQIGKQNVYFEKNNKPGFAHLLPRITQRGNSYFLEYAYYQKGVPFNSIIPNDERPILMQFSYFGAMLEFLNQTVFYEFDSTTSFNDGTRTLFLENYSEVVNNLLRGKTGPQVLEVLYYVPVFFFKKIDRDFLWNILTQTLETPVTNAGLNTEDIVIHLLQGIDESYQNKNIFLAELINRKTKSKTSLLYRLFYKIDGDNFTALVKLLWTVWKESTFIFPDPETNPIYSNTDGSLFLPYQSEKTIGFYFTSLKVEEKSNTELTITYGTGKYETYTGKDAGGGTTTKSREIKETVSYHPYYPIYLVKTDQQDFAFDDLKQETLVPAFVLHANELKTLWNNVATAGEYTVDILTTLSGLGNIAKFKHLTKLNKLSQAAKTLQGADKVVRASNVLRHIKGAAGVVELSSSSLNLTLKLSDKRNESPYKELSEFLFYLELLTLAGELTAPLKVGLRKSAREVIEKSDGAFRKRYDELFGELYKVANIDSNILLKNKEFVNLLEDLKYSRVSRVYPDLLSLEEEAVLRFYTTNSGYKNFNKALRSEIKMTDEFLAQEQLMNQSLDKLPNYKTDALLYRIENLTDAKIEEYYKVGEEVTNKHFTSSSYDMFSIGEAMRKRKFTVLIRIETKTGKLIEPVSTFKDEGEVLFKSNTSFYVDKFTENINPLNPFGSKIKTIIIKEK